jgi:hypothetical protein
MASGLRRNIVEVFILLSPVILSFGIVFSTAIYDGHKAAARKAEYEKTMREGKCTEEFSDGKTPIGPVPKVVIGVPGFYRVCRNP